MTAKAPVGMAWWTPESYPRFLAIADDADTRPKTFEHLEQILTRKVAQLEAMGLAPRKVFVDVDELADFCKRLGLPVNMKSVSRWVTVTMALGNAESVH